MSVDHFKSEMAERRLYSVLLLLFGYLLACVAGASFVRARKENSRTRVAYNL